MPSQDKSKSATDREHVVVIKGTGPREAPAKLRNSRKPPGVNSSKKSN